MKRVQTILKTMQHLLSSSVMNWSEVRFRNWELLILSLLIFNVTACKKVLDKKSDNKLTTIDRLEDLQTLLDNADYLTIGRVPVYGEVSSDDYFLPESYFNGADPGSKGRLAYTWQYFVYAYDNLNDWSRAYLPIYIANICLEEIQRFPRTSVNELQWNNIKGSALFIRAFYFLNLAWVYAKAYDSTTSISDLGIALRLGTDDHVPTVRATVAESYDQLISDAKESLLYLPDIGIHPLRPSKAAAYALLARAYLSMRNYDSAFKYADRCLQIRNELMDYNGDGDLVNPVNGTNSPFRKYNKETIFYADINNNILTQNIREGGYIDSTLYGMYANDDVRKTAFFKTDNTGYQKFKGSYTQNASSLFGGIATDEMFLIRAECYARKEMITEAMNDLNALMVKRWKNNGSWTPLSATDRTDALNKILNERRKELLLRGLRWPDIKRLNKEGSGIILKRIVVSEPYELLPNSDKYALPLPQEIIDITGVMQNEGWSDVE